ncbi:hypothetical protein MMC17_002084 [Xylographa soralifera]|nr:hypothetical protein [Xylographa soralifera]
MPSHPPPTPIDLTLPPNFSSALAPTGRTYYLNHTARTTSFIHPVQTAYREPFTPGLPYPFERKVDVRGRAYYADHEARTTSRLHPLKLEELGEQGFLEAGGEVVDDEGGAAARPWVVLERATAPAEGELYCADYRTGEVDSVGRVGGPVPRGGGVEELAEGRGRGAKL